MKELGILEGILFVVGDDGITIETLCNVMDKSETEIKSLLSLLKKRYDEEASGLRISYIADTFKLTTKPEHKEYYKKLVSEEEINTLSPAALETLAIIAYNAPITRVQIDEMRGVSSNHILRKLLARELIKVTGKADMPGRPSLYATTNSFLDYFGLATLADLPKIKKDNNESETELYDTIFKEK